MTARPRPAHPSAALVELVSLELRQRVLDLLEAHQDCSRELTETHVHELRLAARHLQPVLELCLALDPDSSTLRHARKRVGALLRRTGTLRDLHLRRTALVTTLRAGPLREALLQRTGRDLRKEERTIRERLARMPLEKLSRAMLPPTSSEDQFRSALQGSVARRRERLEDRIVKLHPGDDLQLHKARVALKRYRYMVEAFAEHLPSVTSTHRSRLKRHQERLGRWHDEQVLTQWLADTRGHLAATLRLSCAQLTARKAAWCRAEQRKLVDALRHLIR